MTEVPYPGHSHAETHPNRTAAIARLFGVSAPNVATARILEIACGDGSNLFANCLLLAASALHGLRPGGERESSRPMPAPPAYSFATSISSWADLASLGSIGHFDYIVVHVHGGAQCATRCYA